MPRHVEVMRDLERYVVENLVSLVSDVVDDQFREWLYYAASEDERVGSDCRVYLVGLPDNLITMDLARPMRGLIRPEVGQEKLVQLLELM